MKRLLFLFAVLIATLLMPKAGFSLTYWDYLDSLLNPHEQINDQGDILWNKCLICHPTLPDVDRDRRIEDVELFYKEDMKQLCFNCHPEPMHPGGQFVGREMGKTEGPPNHLVTPPEHIKMNIRMSTKESLMMLPLEPGTDKVFCATCHNPHERGVLKGRADVGADMRARLRSGGRSICQFCHRK